MECVPLAERETIEAVAGVHLTQLAASDGMSVQHFRIEPGATIPEHSHPHEQVGYVARGAFTFSVEGDEYVLGPGETYTIPAQQAHEAANRTEEPVRGIDVFSPPRDEPDWQ